MMTPEQEQKLCGMTCCMDHDVIRDYVNDLLAQERAACAATCERRADSLPDPQAAVARQCALDIKAKGGGKIESEVGGACNVCGGPLRYGERHLRCAPQGGGNG